MYGVLVTSGGVRAAVARDLCGVLLGGAVTDDVVPAVVVVYLAKFVIISRNFCPSLYSSNFLLLTVVLTVFSEDLFCNLLGDAYLCGDDDRVQLVGTEAAAVRDRGVVLLVDAVGVLVRCGVRLLGVTICLSNIV